MEKISFMTENHRVYTPKESINIANIFGDMK